MSKEEFSNRAQEKRETRRAGQNHGSFGGSRQIEKDGEKMRRKGAHSNVGVGDEGNPIKEEEDK